MAHDILKDSAEAQSGRASLFIVGILLGGVLLLSSYIAPLFPIFSRATFKIGNQSYNFFSDALALAAALLLGIPVIVHAVKHLLAGEMQMDELVALAILASLVAVGYRTAGVVAFFLLLANLVETRTALGARASIEALVRISPTKAHRISAAGVEELVDPSESARATTFPPTAQSPPGRPPSTRPISPASRCRWTRASATRSSPARAIRPGLSI